MMKNSVKQNPDKIKLFLEDNGQEKMNQFDKGLTDLVLEWKGIIPAEIMAALLLNAGGQLYGYIFGYDEERVAYFINNFIQATKSGEENRKAHEEKNKC